MKGNNVSGDPLSVASALHEAIRRRAEEIYVRNGKIPGKDVENWAQAEWEIRQEVARAGRNTRKAVVVKIDGVQYVGEYKLDSSGDYQPGELDPGCAVTVRFEGDKMFLRRANGEELETTVVHRFG